MDALVVDGAELFRVSIEEAEQTLADGAFRGVPLVKPDFLRAHVSVTKGLPSFEVALGRPAGAAPSWVVVHVVRVDDGYARVRVEGLTCFGCKQSLMIGNPVDYQIYEGVTDPMAALASARARSSLPCPSCGHALQRPAIAVALR